MEKGGYIIYAVGHQHAGGVGTALYGQVTLLFSLLYDTYMQCF